jgi:hypothetical protein
MLNKCLCKTAVLGLALFFIFTFDITSAGSEKGAGLEQTQKQKPAKGRADRSEDNSFNNLSPEIKAKLEAERDAFFAQTADLRAEIYKQKLAMKDELQKSEPDGQKLKALQKEISRLEALLNKERYKFIKRMEKIHPEAPKGYFERGIMGND